MADVVELQNITNVCRLCLSTDDPKSSIFGFQDNPVPLNVKIQTCLSIQISLEDKVSTLICTNCLKNVNKWHSYKESCLRSQDKLQEWLVNHLPTPPAVVTIKEEPVDLDFHEDLVEVLSEYNEDSDPIGSNLGASSETVRTPKSLAPTTSNENSIIPAHILHPTLSLIHPESEPEPEPEPSVDPLSTATTTVPLASTTSTITFPNSDPKDSSVSNLVQIKTEPVTTGYETDCNIEIESVTGTEILINPMALNSQEEKASMLEPEKTAEVSKPTKSATFLVRKKPRRRFHTHFRGPRRCIYKCDICAINLHSKFSHKKHVERYHSAVGVDKIKTEKPSVAEAKRPEPRKPLPRKKKKRKFDEAFDATNEGDVVEDVEDEIVSLEKDSPLTPVQQNIISQLKTFTCYSCQRTFNDRRTTLKHIREHMPDLRPYTCIACLTEFADRLTYKRHCSSSFQCAMKIALVVPKHGSEKYFTCNMCLKSLSNRRELLSHLSKHSDKQYKQLMNSSSSSPARSPPKLRPMVSVSSASSALVRGPYNNGDPDSNFPCDLCGMIYRRKPNMTKHRELCKRLLPEVRTSYKCAHCGKTFLVFKKFHSHILHDHSRKDFVCWTCNGKFKQSGDYLAHYETHRNSGARKLFNRDWKKSKAELLANHHQVENRGKTMVNGSSSESSALFHCALCDKRFPNRGELVEHTNLHLKVKIYSCVICRSMFSNPTSLEIHMKDHGIEDPNERDTNTSFIEYEKAPSGDKTSSIHGCVICNKGFVTSTNLKRHIKSAHENHEMYSCRKCGATFELQDEFIHHLKCEHPPSSMGRSPVKCHVCLKTFYSKSNLNVHFRSAHLNQPESASAPQPKLSEFSCEKCGKTFQEPQSLQSHRGWHARTGTLALKPPSVTQISPKPAKARKSFPNPPPKLIKLEADKRPLLKCQVCDDTFNDVTELRKHLWDVHCAKSKPERSFTTDELQCELCTNVFPDQESLRRHLQWHKENPILTAAKLGPAGQRYVCEYCNKPYSSLKILSKHKKLHKVSAQLTPIRLQSVNMGKLKQKNNNNNHNLQQQLQSLHTCSFCQKTFANQRSLVNHKSAAHYKRQKLALARTKKTSSTLFDGTRVKSEPGVTTTPTTTTTTGSSVAAAAVHQSSAGIKPVTCLLCKEVFPNMKVLYQHKQTKHYKNQKIHVAMKDNMYVNSKDNSGRVCCTLCNKSFFNFASYKQHFTVMHKQVEEKYDCSISNCDMTFNNHASLTKHLIKHTNLFFVCLLCERHFYQRKNILEHLVTMHKNIYTEKTGVSIETNNFFHEIDLNLYTVKSFDSITCPVCHGKYPNTKSMKVHYIRTHDNRWINNFK